MRTKEEELAHLKAMREELDKLTKDEFAEIVRKKYGDGMANMVSGAGFDEWARQMIEQTLDKQIADLEK